MHPYGVSAEDIAAPFANSAARTAPAVVSGILAARGRAELPPHLPPRTWLRHD